MTDYRPTPVSGAHPCEMCAGTGVVMDASEGSEQETECPECDGLGEWFR